MTVEETTASGLLERTADFGALYEQNIDVLVGAAMKRFGISQSDAQTLAHDVFLSYFLKADEVLDPRAWLIGAIYNASKHFLRSRARLTSLPEGMLDTADPRSRRVTDALADQIASREAFYCVTPRCQLALRLRFLEGYTYPEIAAELHTSEGYAQKLVKRCVRQAKQRYSKGDCGGQHS